MLGLVARVRGRYFQKQCFWPIVQTFTSLKFLGRDGIFPNIQQYSSGMIPFNFEGFQAYLPLVFPIEDLRKSDRLASKEHDCPSKPEQCSAYISKCSKQKIGSYGICSKYEVVL